MLEKVVIAGIALWILSRTGKGGAEETTSTSEKVVRTPVISDTGPTGQKSMTAEAAINRVINASKNSMIGDKDAQEREQSAKDTREGMEKKGVTKMPEVAKPKPAAKQKPAPTPKTDPDAAAIAEAKERARKAQEQAVSDARKKEAAIKEKNLAALAKKDVPDHIKRIVKERQEAEAKWDNSAAAVEERERQRLIKYIKRRMRTVRSQAEAELKRRRRNGDSEKRIYGNLSSEASELMRLPKQLAALEDGMDLGTYKTTQWNPSTRERAEWMRREWGINYVPFSG